MASSPKKISRKDIRKPDQFVTLTGKVFHLASEYRRQSIVCLALLLTVLVGLWGWDSYRQRQNRLAALEYARALSLYHSGKYNQAVDLFTQIRNYSASTYSRLALLYQANSYIAMQDSAKATASLQELLRREGKESFLRQLGLLSLASLQERTDRCKEAGSNYAEAEKMPGPFKDEALLGKARCSFQSSDLKEALSSYRQYLTSYPGSERGSEISLRIQEIEEKIGAGQGAK